MIVTIHAEDIDQAWSDVVPFIEKALSRGSVYNSEELKEGLKQSRYQLWTWQTDKIDAVMVTSVRKGIDCLLLTMAGSGLRDWVKCLPWVEEWAKHYQCKRMVLHGRKGWSRVLGYTITGQDELGIDIMVKEL